MQRKVYVERAISKVNTPTGRLYAVKLADSDIVGAIVVDFQMPQLYVFAVASLGSVEIATVRRRRAVISRSAGSKFWRFGPTRVNA